MELSEELQKRWLSGGAGGAGGAVPAERTSSPSPVRPSRLAAMPTGAGVMARRDSFACSVVSSLSGDDGQSVDALGGCLDLGLDGAAVQEGAVRVVATERSGGRLVHDNGAASNSNARSAFRGKKVSRSAGGVGVAPTGVSLSLSSSESEGTVQTGSVRSSLPSSSLPPPPPMPSASAAQSPFLNTLLGGHHQRQQQRRQVSQTHNRRQQQQQQQQQRPLLSKRTVSAGSLSSLASSHGTGHSRTSSHNNNKSKRPQVLLSAHAPLRHRLAGTGLVSDCVHSATCNPPRPSGLGAVGRSRSTPLVGHVDDVVRGFAGAPSLSGGGSFGGGGGGNSCSASVVSMASYQSGEGALSCSALGLAPPPPPPPPSGGPFATPPRNPARPLSRAQSTASTASYPSAAGTTSSMSATHRSAAAPQSSSLASVASASGDSVELLAGRPMRRRQHNHRRARSALALAASPLTAAVGIENGKVQRALDEYNAKNDTQCVQSYREAEVRNRTNIVKGEIKYKLGRMVPKVSLPSRRSQTFGGGGGPSEANAVQLQRASGCLT